MDKFILKNLYLGTCSWNHRDWVWEFYPRNSHPKDFLKFYAKQFNSVEINSTWYQIPEEATIKKWCEAVPKDFIFALKVPRVITHEKILENCQDELKQFLYMVDKLENKLGPLLFQFPSYFTKSYRDQLTSFIKVLPKGYKFAIEIRDKNFLGQEFYNLLNRHNIALVLTSYSRMPRLDLITSDFTYIRWIGDRKKIKKLATRWNKVVIDRSDDLRWWREKILNYLKNKISIYAYFNNHYSGYAIDTAKVFMEMLMEE